MTDVADNIYMSLPWPENAKKRTSPGAASCEEGH
jgi:hypothetical protein